MDSIHDLGGMHGFGPVDPTPAEPPFHEPWEGRAHGLMLTTAIAVGGGSIRPYIERLDAATYLSSSYYERWITATAARLVARGAVTEDEIAERTAEVAAGAAFPTRSDPDGVAFVRSLFRPLAHEDPVGPPPRFAPGDAVRVRRLHPATHTRCPRYVRGAAGTIALVHPAQPLPDLLVAGETRVEPFYSVAFTPTELWGDDAEPGAATIYVDLWDSYLDALKGAER